MGPGNTSNPSSVIPVQGTLPSWFEREQIRAHRVGAWITGGSVIASLVVAWIAYLGVQRAQAREAAAAFELKLAEIVMNARNAYEARDKAIALEACFPDHVPENFSGRLTPKDKSWGRESHNMVFHALMQDIDSADHRAAVLKTWLEVFPGDAVWVKEIPTR